MHGDTYLVALFREWIDLNRQYQAEDTASEVLRRKRDSVEGQIHHTPASGARGLAVKGYFLGYYHADGTPEIADFSTPDSYADNGELAHWDSRAVKSFFDDAARFVPELQSVVGGILSAPVRVPPRPEWMAALRERWEALAAEYVAPLPEGDAGIIAAIKRERDLVARERALYREFNVTFEIEADVRNPIIGPALDHLNDYILDTPPVGRDGVLAKLRYVIDDRNGLITEGAEEPLKQVLAALEGNAA